MIAKKSIQVRGATELLQAIQGIEKGKRKVITQAVNKTATGARTDSVKLLRNHLMLKAKSIRDNIRVVKATWSKPQAVLVAKGKKGLPLMGNYPVRPSKMGGRKPKEGVSVQIKKHGPRKTIKGSFVARMKSGKVSVFKRAKGAARLPIRMMHGVGFIGYLQRGMLQRQLNKRISVRLVTNLEHSINNLLRTNLNRIARLKG